MHHVIRVLHGGVLLRQRLSQLARTKKMDNMPAGIAGAGKNPNLAPAVVGLEPDLLFAARLSDVITAKGGRPVITDTPDAFLAAVDQTFPVLALMDLNTPGDRRSAIMRCKLRPETRQVPLYTFGSHVDVETLKAARQAGADHAWARSKMVAELVALVDRYINPPIHYPEGWHDALSPTVRAGRSAFNAGDYFEQHELLEEAWRAEPRPIRDMYQGILQIGLAFFQIEQGNWAGALKMFRRGLPRLRELPAVCQGVNIGALRAAAVAIHAEVTELGPDHLTEFDRTRFPKIQFAA